MEKQKSILKDFKNEQAQKDQIHQETCDKLVEMQNFVIEQQ